MYSEWQTLPHNFEEYSDDMDKTKAGTSLNKFLHATHNYCKDILSTADLKRITPLYTAIDYQDDEKKTDNLPIACSLLFYGRRLHT